jgi:hypothetical protein
LEALRPRSETRSQPEAELNHKNAPNTCTEV